MKQIKDVVVGIGFYKRDQWPQLLELAADSYRLEDTYDQWLEIVASSVEKIRSRGIEPVLVHVDIDELTVFCKEKGMQNNASSRSLFIAELARRRK